MNRLWPSLIGALAFAMPDGPASPDTIMAQICGDPGALVSIIIIDDDPAGAPERCRDSACHVGCDQRRRTLSRRSLA